MWNEVRTSKLKMVSVDSVAAQGEMAWHVRLRSMISFFLLETFSPD